MIAALADAGALLGEARYLDAAVATAGFVHERMRDGDGRLLRTFNRGAARIPAYLEDHAFLLEALLSLYEATFDERWFAWARSLGDELLDRFADGERGGFFVGAADGERLIVRRKDLEDTPIPSGSSSAALGLLRLAALTGEARYEDAALGALRLAAPMAARYPSAFGHLLCALDFHTAPVRELAIVGARSAGAARGRARAPPPPPRARGLRRRAERRAAARGPHARRRRRRRRLPLRALRLPRAGQRPGGAAGAARSSSRSSAGLSTSSAAARFSSRWAIREVPGIGTIAGERASSHASATWPLVAPCAARDRVHATPALSPALPAASGNHGM